MVYMNTEMTLQCRKMNPCPTRIHTLNKRYEHNQIYKRSYIQFVLIVKIYTQFCLHSISRHCQRTIYEQRQNRTARVYSPQHNKYGRI